MSRCIGNSGWAPGGVIGFYEPFPAAPSGWPPPTSHGLQSSSRPIWAFCIAATSAMSMATAWLSAAGWFGSGFGGLAEQFGEQSVVVDHRLPHIFGRRCSGSDALANVARRPELIECARVVDG